MFMYALTRRSVGILPSLLLAGSLRAAAPSADSVLHAGLSPEKAVRAATVPPGFSLHLFASEPDVRQPIAFCDDDRGRLWVVEGLAYPRRHGLPPNDGRPPGADRETPSASQMRDILGGPDRVLVFEDTDGDHRFDRRTVFLEGLNLVSGIEYGHGGLWIGAAPYLLYIPVTEGDVPKPGGAPRILLDGWNFSADTHETLNTFSWGPDGWLYGCHGVFCPSQVGRPGAPESERQWVDAGVWRYHPVHRVFEIFTEGGSNPWGVDFDEHGEAWTEMCVIPHLFHMPQGGRLQRQGGAHYCFDRDEIARHEAYRERGSRKPVFPFVFEDVPQSADHLHWTGAGGPHAGNGRSDAVGGGHAHAGMLCYLGTNWPAEYRGRLILGNIHGQRLNSDIPERRGASFVGRHGPDVINFNDRWSQTLNQRLAPDGSVFVIDWYDKNQCHHNRDDGHDRSNGRIYKLVYDGGTPGGRSPSVDLARIDSPGLSDLVGSRHEWHSRHARRLLAERYHALSPDARGTFAPVTAALTAQVRSGAATPARLRALWALHVTTGVPTGLATELLRQPDEYLRAWTVQCLTEHNERFSREQSGPAAADPARWQVRNAELARLAREDSSPLVRRYVASALQRVPVPERIDAVRGLLTHGGDARDPLLPLLYWYATEAVVATNPQLGLELVKTCQLPKVRELIVRRLGLLSLSTSR